jgi:antitoxin ParD1/3/4
MPNHKGLTLPRCSRDIPGAFSRRRHSEDQIVLAGQSSTFSPPHQPVERLQEPLRGTQAEVEYRPDDQRALDRGVGVNPGTIGALLVSTDDWHNMPISISWPDFESTGVIDMPTRNVVLTDQQAEMVEELVSSGRYQNASEVLRDGLRLLQRREAEELAKLEALRGALDEAEAAIAAGDLVDYSPTLLEKLDERERENNRQG